MSLALDWLRTKGEDPMRYLDDVFRYAMARLGDREEAEDVAIETVQALPNPCHRQELRAYMVGVARCKVADRLRQGIGGFGMDAMFGGRVALVGFVPLDPDGFAPAEVRVGFSRRPSYYANEWTSDTPAERPVGEVALPLRRVAADRLEYFPALGLDHYGFQLPLVEWGFRADALAKAGRTFEAARAYEPLGKAAKLYDELGMTDDAERVRMEAATLRARRPRE